MVITIRVAQKSEQKLKSIVSSQRLLFKVTMTKCYIITSSSFK